MGGGGCQCSGAGLFVRPKEPGDFGAQQLDEGAREHLFGLLRCVPEVVLWMSEYIKQGFYQLLVLMKGTEGPRVSHDQLIRTEQNMRPSIPQRDSNAVTPPVRYL